MYWLKQIKINWVFNGKHNKLYFVDFLKGKISL